MDKNEKRENKLVFTAAVNLLLSGMENRGIDIVDALEWLDEIIGEHHKKITD